MRRPALACAASALLLAACAHRFPLEAGEERHALCGVPATFGEPAQAPPEGAAISWSFGDGTRAEGASVRHAYPHAGAFTLTETVADRWGTRSASARVIVDRRGPFMAVPPEAQSAIVLDRFFNRLPRYRSFLERAFTQDRVDAALREAGQLLGFDPRSPKAIRGAGIDPDEGLAWVTFAEEPEATYLIVGIDDGARAAAALNKAFAAAGGRLERGPEGSIRARLGGGQVAYFLLDRGYAVVRLPRPAADAPSALGQFRRAPDQGLLSVSDFAALRAAISGEDVQLYLSPRALATGDPGGRATPEVRQVLDRLGTTLLGADVGEEAVTAQALTAIGPEGRPALARLFASRRAPTLPERAPAGATAYLGASCDVSSLSHLVLGTSAEKALGEALGLDLGRALALASAEGAIAAYLDPGEYYRHLAETQVPLPRGDVVLEVGVRDTRAADQALGEAIGKGLLASRRALSDGGERYTFLAPSGRPCGAALTSGSLVLGYGTHRFDQALAPDRPGPALAQALRDAFPPAALAPGRLLAFIDFAQALDGLFAPMPVPGVSAEDLLRARLVTQMLAAPFAGLRDLAVEVAPAPMGLAAQIRLRLR